MATSRFVLDKPILIIGFSIIKDGEYKNYPTLGSLIMASKFNGLDLAEVKYNIISITPNKEHIVDIEYSDSKGLGYQAEFSHWSDNPVELQDYNVYFTNQYPTASYGQLSADADYYWKLDADSNHAAIISVLPEINFCHRYETLSTVLETLFSFENTDKNIGALRSRILRTMDEDFTAWDIIRSEIIKGSEVYTTDVSLRPEIDLTGGECSQGPVSTLPGKTFSLKEGKTLYICDNHPNRLAAHRVQGETDSFGCEYYYLCDECYEKEKAEQLNSDTSGNCNWCKKFKAVLRNHRDIEEGSCGRVYQVCQECIDAERKRWAEEDEYDD